MKKITDQDIKIICELLKNGDSVPAKYKEALFGKEIEKKEYELKYSVKEKEEDIIANTYSCPLQKVKTYNPNEIIDHKNFIRETKTKEKFSGWYNKLIFGDNLQVLKELLTNELLQKQIKENGGIKLIYIDPPFATKSDFTSGKGEKAYSDKLAGAEFIEFIRKRLVLMRELLSNDGSIYVHLDYKKSHYIKIILDEVFGENNFINEIIWKSTDPKNNVTNTLGNIHQVIFFYSKNKDKKIFNIIKTNHSDSANKEYSHVLNEYQYIKNGKIVESIDKIRDCSLRFKLENTTSPKMSENKKFIWHGFCPKNGWRFNKEKMDFLYNNGEILLKNGKSSSRCQVKYLDNMDGIPLQTLWDDLGTMKSGKGVYPTQKPELLLERILKISTKEGDIVLDAFSGSGTTLAVAEKLGRKWIGIDGGKLSIYTIQNRLMNLKEEIGNKGKSLKPKPFAVYNAGLYDFQILKNLDWDTYIWFTLSLFQCKQDKHLIDGIPFDGYLNLNHVQVFDYNHGRQGIVLDRGYLENIDEKIGNKLGKRIYIIAPATKIDGMLEDIVNINGREYFLLRVPYSIIKELYTKDFEKIKQPTTEDDVNNTVEAVGFDFIRVPKLKVEYKINGEKAEIKLLEFESKVISNKPLDYKNLETLSTVIIDYNYNGEYVNFEEVLFADVIKKSDYTISLDKEKLNNKCMIIYIDIFGNERKEIITLDNFIS